MQTIKRHKNDMMKDIVICGCNHKEYYGHVVMRDGINYCRNCIYEIWSKESGWRPDHSKDYIFPIYEDGKDYSKEEQNYGE